MARRTTGRQVSSGYQGPTLPRPSLAPVPGTTKTAAAAQAAQAQPLPIDATYNNTVGANNQGLANALAQIGYNRGQTNSQYGFTPVFDAHGNITGENVDPSNPFSKAALLQQSYTRSKATYGQGLASRGQLYSSAYQGAQDYAGSQYAQGYDATRRAYEQAQQGYTGQEAAARNAAATGNANAFGSYVDRSLAAKGPLLPDPGEAAPTASYGSAGATRTVKVKAPRLKGRSGTKISSGYKGRGGAVQTLGSGYRP